MVPPSLLRARSEARVVILAYHRIAALDPDPDGLCVTPADFRAQMAHVRGEYYPMPLDDLVRAAAADEIPDGAIAVTLDDGYLDALEIASPILVEYGIPATFFVTTGCLDEAREFWWDTLAQILCSEAPVPPLLDLSCERTLGRMQTRTLAQRSCAWQDIRGRMVRMSHEERERTITHLAEWSGLDMRPRPTHRPMLAREVAKLATRPDHMIGAHGIEHLFLPTQAVQVGVREATESRARLEALLGRPVLAFAYPYGGLDEVTVEAVRAAGYQMAVTTKAGRVLPNADPMRLPRYEITARDSGPFPF